MMLAVHSVHENFVLPGQAQSDARPVPVVATNVYLRTAAGWRMIVHHASPAPAENAPAASEAPPKLLH
jgi:ketosteroid isomerase-like protein